MRAFDLMLFDLDGTLVDTAPEIMDAVNDTLRHFALPEVTQAQVNDWIGQGTRELLLLALADSTATPVEALRAGDLLAGIEPVYQRCYRQRCGTRSQLYPQVRQTLQGLRAQGVKLALVTNKEASYTQVVLDVHQLGDLLDVVVSGDSLPTKKPDPAGVRQCLAQFAVAPQRALFVGDSSIDAATARNAGVPVWLLPYGYNMGQPVADCAPDRVIEDISVLLNM